MNLRGLSKAFFDNRRIVNKDLASDPTADRAALGKQKRVLQHVAKSIARTRQDIAKWNQALNLTNTDDPKNWLLQNLYDEVRIDALLTSQLENRLQKAMAVPFRLVNEKGDIDEEQTAKFKLSDAHLDLVKAIWEKKFYGYNLVELQLAGDTVQVNMLPRQNVVPQTGKFYPDYSEDTPVLYRNMPEFGKWLLEFTNAGDPGLVNKAVPHILFKRFAQSCWSELCEIYGIPPRVMKTNTQDPGSLNRAEAMMRDMSAAAWFIIDSDETFEWAKGTDTDGAVYSNLIQLCNNEISLLITGAVIGQDTKNGSRSKDESGMEQLDDLVQSDLTMISQAMNSKVLPALVSIGYLKGNIRFEFMPVDDLKELWGITKDALQYYKVDADWVKTKFGVQITAEREAQTTDGEKKLQYDGGFFGQG